MSNAEIALTGFDDAPTRARGRDIQAGYRRGWGLQYSDLAERIRMDPLYNEALALATGRSLISEMNRMNLYLIIRFGLADVGGHIVEFGAYRGGNALFMAMLCKELSPGRKVVAFDTFAGMPDTDASRDAHRQGDFADTMYEDALEAAARHGLDNLSFVKGLFSDTAPEVLPALGEIALNHVDCDIYDSVRYSYDASLPYMAHGGYWAFDDSLYSSCIGAMEAVEEVVIRRDGRYAEQVFPHLVYRNLPVEDAA
jgi:hypothetical protein